jgi:tight adherence protein C
MAIMSTPAAIGPLAAVLATLALGAIARPLTTNGRRTISAPHLLPAIRPQRRRRRIVLGAGVGGVALGAAVAGPISTAVAAAAMLVVRRLDPIRAARRRRADIERALPEAIDLLVLSVRAGLTPFQAVCDLARSGESAISDAFGEVVRRTERGQPFADALAALPDRLGAPAGAVADVIATTDRHGLALGPALDLLTNETRAARQRLDLADSRKLPIRLSFPLVTCTLPSFVLLAIAPAVIAALSSLGATAW